METSLAAIPAASKHAKISGENLRNPSLPLEIIADIFSRLPVKSVFRMECLSKYYYLSLSKSPHFVKSHLRQSSRLRPSLIAKKRDGVYLIQGHSDKIIAEIVTLPPNIDYPRCTRFDIVASSNGIVLVDVGRRGCLWNPSTMTFLKLPYKPYVRRGPNDESLYFHKQSWGFGCCKESFECKVVRICKYKSIHLKRVFAEVISVNTDCVWRSVDFSGLKTYKQSGVSFNEMVYWEPDKHEDEVVILTFDLAKEKFAWTSCPVNGVGYIIVFKGSLAICDFNHCEKSCTLWVLKDEHAVNKDSWMIHCCFDFYSNKLQPLLFLNDHQLLLQVTFPHLLEEQCFLYDLDTKEIKSVPGSSVYYNMVTHYDYAESLVSLYDTVHSSENDSDNNFGGSG